MGLLNIASPIKMPSLLPVYSEAAERLREEHSQLSLVSSLVHLATMTRYLVQLVEIKVVIRWIEGKLTRNHCSVTQQILYPGVLPHILICLHGSCTSKHFSMNLLARIHRPVTLHLGSASRDSHPDISYETS